MTALDHVRPRTSAPPTPAGSARRPSVDLISQGVVAAYLHDISTRRPRLRRRPSGRVSAPVGACA